mmetsp:Transcript_183/g.516  ORF Transcript_183/g.516 Transcript_183/m.516 type:complete len:829 (+) Transcript_183:137-2623(+)
MALSVPQAEKGRMKKSKSSNYLLQSWSDWWAGDTRRKEEDGPLNEPPPNEVPSSKTGRTVDDGAGPSAAVDGSSPLSGESKVAASDQIEATGEASVTPNEDKEGVQKQVGTGETGDAPSPGSAQSGNPAPPPRVFGLGPVKETNAAVKKPGKPSLRNRARRKQSVLFIEEFQKQHPGLMGDGVNELAEDVADILLDEEESTSASSLVAPQLPKAGERLRRKSTISLPSKTLASNSLNWKDVKDTFWYSYAAGRLHKISTFPNLNVLIIIIGSRGDVQPFMVLAEGLIEEGHRVRIGTHGEFKDFVAKNPQIEFVDIGGDPRKMMEFVVKNPSMITTNYNEVRTQQNIMKEIFHGSWDAACKPGVDGTPYRPDVVLTNPPSLVHVHLAEALSIPCQVWFTMPWTPNSLYKHPFAWFGQGWYSNWNSYTLVDMLCYSGNSASLNEWRQQKLKLEPVLRKGASLQHHLKVPHVYMYSESLVPRPSEWGEEVDVCGFLFPSSKEADSYEPDQDLMDFLCDGEPPIYIGFGSIVIQDADRFTSCVMEAIEMSGVRCILSQGWMGLGKNNTSQNVYVIGSCPHDWLFPRCSAVVHHGGAGTTATGLKYGRPTVVIPFFGDQPFWGEVVLTMGVGPPPIPQTELTPELLCCAIKECFQTDIVNAARRMGSDLRQENSKKKAVELFHRYLPIDAHGRKVFTTFENMRFRAGKWQHRNSRHAWGDSRGLISRTKESVTAGIGWEFDGDWEIIVKKRETDKYGWQYHTDDFALDGWLPNFDFQGGTIYRRREWRIMAKKVDISKHQPRPSRARDLSIGPWNSGGKLPDYEKLKGKEEE